MDARGTVGLYGKIPGRGDFISRRVSREFTEFWDPWLQNSLSCSRTQLNEKWLNVYLTSPIWRFVLSPGLCGRKVWIGVVMPSVDKVGRYFPLTIVTSLPEEINPFNITTLALDWFNHAESIALSTLEENNFDFDVFDKQVDQLSQYLPEFDGKDMQASVSSVNFRTSNGWRFPAERANSVDKSYSSLLWNRFSTYSLWWCDGSENIEPSLLVSDGLPSVESYAAMLDGQWQQWSWDVCPVQYLPDFPSRDKPDDVVPKNGITPNVPEPKIEPQPETLEPSVLKEPIIIEADIAQEHEEVQDNWWIEETDQLAKDAISNVANNLTDDTPESLLLMADPVEDESLAQTMLFGDEARAEVDAENTRMEVEPLAKPMFVEKESLDVDSIDKTSLIEEDSMAQTMIIAAPESIEDSIEKTQLFFADSRIIEPIDKTELNAASVLNLNRSTAQEPETNSGQKVTINESTILGSLSETNEMGLGIVTIGDTIAESNDESTEESNDDSEVSASADSDNIASDLDNVGGLGQNKRIHFDWTSTACTDAGKVRKINEDAYLDYPQRGIWVVADGVGGHTGGAIASQMIVRQLLKVKRPKNLASFIEDVQNQLQYVNRYLLENVSESQEYLVGSTVAVLLIYGNNAACVWAGDSRIYLNRDGKTRRLTKDHSEEEEQADAIRRNEIVESLKPVNPNIITRAIGADNLLELDIEIIDLLEDDAFLICSDGLYKEVSEDEIAEYLNREDTEVISRGLLNLALDRNARDNVTVISVMLAG